MRTTQRAPERPAFAGPPPGSQRLTKQGLSRLERLHRHRATRRPVRHAAPHLCSLHLCTLHLCSLTSLATRSRAKLLHSSLLLLLIAACDKPQQEAPGSEPPPGQDEARPATTDPADAKPTAPELKSEEDKTLYALGLTLGKNVETFDLSSRDIQVVTSGMRDALGNADAKVDLEVYAAKIQSLAKERTERRAKKEQARAATFLAEVAKEDGVVALESGVLIKMLTPGKGKSPAATDTVKVHYKGTLADGTVFDSSMPDEGKAGEKADEPATFSLQHVIPCWRIALQKMKESGRAKLWCPSNSAYRDRGKPARLPGDVTIPGGAALLFEVTLVDVKREPT